MSLTGRYVIDRLKKSLAGWFQLPAPPMASAGYWEGTYQRLQPTDVFEWGVDWSSLSEYKYHEVNDYFPGSPHPSQQTGPRLQTTLAETLGYMDSKKVKQTRFPLAILGCGNSQLPIDILEDGWPGPVYGIDISTRCIQAMSHRGKDHQQAGRLHYLQDDATELSAVNNESLAAAIDKGLIDALFCVDEYELCHDVMESVHRVLQPSGVFVTLSYSRPEFCFQNCWELQVAEVFLGKVLISSG